MKSTQSQTFSRLTIAALVFIATITHFVPARSQDLQSSSAQKGAALIKSGKIAEAIKFLKAEKVKAPKDSSITFLLAQAIEKSGLDLNSALSYYKEVTKLDPTGLGPEASKRIARLIRRRVEVELEAAQEEFSGQRFPSARKAFLRALELNDGSLKKEWLKARDGYFRCSARLLIAKAKLQKGATVALLTISGAGNDSHLQSACSLLESEFSNACKSHNLKFLLAGKGAQYTIKGSIVGKQFKLAVIESKSGVVRALSNFRTLTTNSKGVSAPDFASTKVTIQAERDDPKGINAPQTIPVVEGSLLKTGDRVRLKIVPSRDAYVYVFHIDSSDHAMLLYPGTENYFPNLAKRGVKSRNPLPGGEPLLVPPLPPKGKAEWFVLDSHKGRERFFVVCSLFPISKTQSYVRRLQGKNGVALFLKSISELGATCKTASFKH